ncbi:hypothetical protein E3E35_10170 [Thermococcus sp. GR7]|uniref:hypothetical protein n=1 Tax=unclassified Thermococcus TaxID=2627626 RepID=UPI00142FC71A|nr:MULTISPECIES: hypothetical protein [unclassified Thermococcus]NJE47752.1 hypothetical protein [Thermococcus sp. GR7]NJE78724.1 hypothetical protein [Thermococcus sp. GR4]NJF22392.1 hypothetical protein [Thermococcus sp. GR5]
MKNDKKVLVGFLIFIFAVSLFIIQKDNSPPPNEGEGLHLQNKSSISISVNETGDNKTLVPIATDGVNFEGETTGFIQCLSAIQVKSQYYQSGFKHLVNFTLSLNGTLKANMTLEGVEGEYFCIPEGVVVYSYYPGERRSSMALFDYNLTPVWKEKYQAFPEMYHNGSIILVDSCIYFVNTSDGNVRRKICPDVRRPYISHIRILGETVYYTVGYYDINLWKTRALIYLVRNEEVKKSEIATIEGHPLGVRLLIDANDEYVAVAYYLRDELRNEKNGVCVFTAGRLIKIACKEFGEWERPINVKLEGNIVYVQTTKGVKAYKILSPW